jgi:hypothetical protein
MYLTRIDNEYNIAREVTLYSGTPPNTGKINVGLLR